MFTGIIEEIGVIENIRRGDKYCNLTVKAKKVLDDVHIGDSIAVNGICLTVTYFNTDIFTADIMNETWNRTALKKLDRGSKVNLERAMSADGRFGGHIVSGHIDGTGTIKTVRRDNNAVWFQIEPSKEILEYVVIKRVYSCRRNKFNCCKGYCKRFLYICNTAYIRTNNIEK